jgi:methyltransferase
MPLVTLSVILGLMLAEARLASRNEAALRARGAIEPAGDVYRVMAILYPACFIVMGVEGYWRARSNLVGPLQDDGLVVSGVLLFAASKALKYWAIHALGPRWSFRVLVLPGVTLVSGGPYRYVAHPNYVAVVGELVGAAMMMSAWGTGPIALAAFGAALWARVRVERGALQDLGRM